MEQKKQNILSILMINLLKGVIYRDSSPALWHSLIDFFPGVNDQASILGLECIIDEAEGYAYFRQKELENDDTKIPRLVQRRPLSYTISLLCVLLRKKILESDSGGDSMRVIISEEQIIDMMSLYMADSSNEVKTAGRIKSALNRVIELGFVKVLDDEKGIYEVRRILKAFVDADWISSLDEKLAQYRETINE